MSTTRRDFMAAAVTAAGVTATHDLAQAESHDHQAVPSDPALRTKSLESLLVEKGLVDPAALDVIVDAYEHKVGPQWSTGDCPCVGRSRLQAAPAGRRFS